MTPGIKIRPAVAGDRQAIIRLLVDAGLPVQDLQNDFPDFLVATRGSELTGAVALELVGEGALLRSLVVAPASRSGALGGRLIAAALKRAELKNVKDIWLLTTDTEGYFSRFGFSPLARTDAPEGIQGLPQFAEICPDSATCMWRPTGEGLHKKRP